MNSLRLTLKMFPFLDVTAEKFLAYNRGDKKNKQKDWSKVSLH